MPAKKTTKKVAAAKSTSKKSAPTKKAPAKTTPAKKSPAVKTLKKAQKSVSTVPKTAKPSITSKKVRSSSSFARAESRAKEYAKDPKKLEILFKKAAEKSKETTKGPFGETWAYLQAMIRLIKAYANGSYREIPVASLLMILVAVIYFVSPVDAILDIIPVVGFLDDALVVSLALKQVKADLDVFMEWELESHAGKA